jgi:hypothetical protein
MVAFELQTLNINATPNVVAAAASFYTPQAVAFAHLPRCLVGLLAQLVFAPVPAKPAKEETGTR